MEYDNRGRVALWKSKSDHASAPLLKGTITAHRTIREGEQIDISLWKNDSANERAPVLSGQIQDRERQDTPPPAPAPAPAAAAAADFDDDLPF